MRKQILLKRLRRLQDKKAKIVARSNASTDVNEVRSINEAIEDDKSLGSGFKIGHSYFCPELKDRKGNIVYGFYKENSHEIIPTKQCMIEDVRAASILWDIKELLKEFIKFPSKSYCSTAFLFSLTDIGLSSRSLWMTLSAS